MLDVVSVVRSILDVFTAGINAQSLSHGIAVLCAKTTTGSSRHISRKFGCTAQGVTLSPYQANRGNELAKEQGLADKCSFQVADALDMPFPDK